MDTGNKQDIVLAFLASATIGATFSEMMRTHNHTISFLLTVTAYENYFKKKLFDIDYRIIFPNAVSKDDLGKSININSIPGLVEKYFNYKIDSLLLSEAVEMRNSLFHFTQEEVDSRYTLEIIFKILIPFMEKFFQEDIETMVGFIYEYDDAALEGYILKQLDEFDIKYSNYIAEVFMQ